jgi:FtsZ-binding cell division protein ZapB
LKKKTEEQEILTRLSERVDQAVQLIQELRRERDELKAERDEIRARIQAMLSSLEGLESD